jgi:hypothetical protein
VIEEEEPDFIDPYDFDMSAAIQHSSGENNGDSSDIYQSSMMNTSMLNTPLMNDKLAR